MELKPVQIVPLVHMQVVKVGANVQNAKQEPSHQRVHLHVHIALQEHIHIKDHLNAHNALLELIRIKAPQNVSLVMLAMLLQKGHHLVRHALEGLIL